MSILKNRARRTHKRRRNGAKKKCKQVNSDYILKIPCQNESCLHNTLQRYQVVNVRLLPCAIMKNYSTALTDFALSNLAQPYLDSMLQRHTASYPVFCLFVTRDTQNVNCIQNLGTKLMIFRNDTESTIRYKRVFQEICQVFLKYFCINWIFDSKVDGKMMYLRCRLKVLRKIQKLEHSIYL